MAFKEEGTINGFNITTQGFRAFRVHNRPTITQYYSAACEGLHFFPFKQASRSV